MDQTQWEPAGLISSFTKTHFFVFNLLSFIMCLYYGKREFFSMNKTWKYKEKTAFN